MPYLTPRLPRVSCYNRFKNVAHGITVLRMLSAFVGEETFLRGVSIYLKKHLYANSVSKDLWDGIGEAAGKHYLQRISIKYS